MREALTRLHTDPGGVGWPIVEGSIASLETLPAATFEVIRNLVAVPRALSYALMHTAHPERLIDALRELPFAPSAFPVAALQDAARDAFMELVGQLQAVQVSDPMAMALSAVGARGRDVAMRLAGLAPELGPLLAAALTTPELSAPTAASPEEVLLAFRRRTPEASQPPALPEIASRFEALVDTRPYAHLARPIRTSPEVLRDIAAAPIVAASLALRRDIPNEGLDKALLLQLWTARTFDPDYFVEMHIATAHHVGRHSNGKETP